MVLTPRRPKTHAQSHEKTSYRGMYSIEDRRRSKSGTIYFVHHKETKRRLVVKLLQKYKDARYNLEALPERQLCQLEAIRWNRKFTPGVYIGLAPVTVDWYRNTLAVGDELVEPATSDLNTNLEYALLMHVLPRERQLDLLISELSPTQMPDQVPFLMNLVQRISEIHSDRSLSEQDNEYWGSLEQIRAKLKSNFAFVESVSGEPKGSTYLNSDIRRGFEAVKDTLSALIEQDRLQVCFAQRVKEARIKRCHGDLKMQNILISSSQPDAASDLSKNIGIIDAIDFNLSLCHIDVLSDIAMLAVDVQARCRSQVVAEWIVDYYLKLTGQQDAIARAVLRYYMLEKAFVGAAVSIIDDDDIALGRNFLKVAQQYIQEDSLAPSRGVR